MEQVRQAVKSAREEFEKAFAATGLNGWPCRGGYTVSGWGNSGRDIKQTLESAGLSYEVNLSGAFIVSGRSQEQAALAKVARVEAVSARPAYSYAP